MARIAFICLLVALITGIIMWINTWTNFFTSARLKRWFKNILIVNLAVAFGFFAVIILSTIDQLL